MNIVFFGSGSFGLPSLKAIHESHHNILAIVTNPDRPSGRGRKIKISPIKEWALQQKIDVLQPENANSPEAIIQLAPYKADAFVVISYGTILAVELIALPLHGCLNVHPSLLPRYRGASPISQCLVNGDLFTGSTVMQISPKVDAGDILAQESMDLDEKINVLDLTDLLAEKSAHLLIETMSKLDDGKVQAIPQDKAQVTYCHKYSKEDSIINWNSPARVIHNRVRGLLAWPGSQTVIEGKVLKVLRTKYQDKDVEEKPGIIIDIDAKKGIGVSTSSGVLWIERLQLEGKRPLEFKDFLNGFNCSVGMEMGV